jgi:hypothetical protein
VWSRVVLKGSSLAGCSTTHPAREIPVGWIALRFAELWPHSHGYARVIVARGGPTGELGPARYAARRRVDSMHDSAGVVVDFADRRVHHFAPRRHEMAGTSTDRVLVARIRLGDETAFETLFRVHYQSL